LCNLTKRFVAIKMASATAMMSSPLDAHAQPPGRLREVFKRLQKATAEEIEHDESIIDFNIAGRHDPMVPVDQFLPNSEILGSAFADFLEDGSSSKGSADNILLPRGYECSTTPGILALFTIAWKTS
jgi:hypothetical protein